MEKVINIFVENKIANISVNGASPTTFSIIIPFSIIYDQLYW